jgi:ribonuclease Z
VAQALHHPQMTVHFLGTGGSWPSAQRNVAATAVKRGGEVVLFDCGEGTQRQFQRGGLSYQAITRIFLSHLHGDHVFGLPGLLKTMQLNERTDPLDLYGPRGLLDLMGVYDRIANVRGQFEVRVHELKDGSAVRLEGYEVRAAKMEHGLTNLAYGLVEDARPGRFDKPGALRLGVPEGPLFRKLQMGEGVKLKDGRTVTPNEVLGPPRAGRKVVITGDTGPCEALVSFARSSTLLISEATYCTEMAERAAEYGHMTAAWAADAAKRAGVGRLMLTHISPRYVDSAQHLAEARPIFPHVTVAEDFDAIEVPLSE